MKMDKLTTFGLVSALALMLLLAGCGGTTGEPGKSDQAPSAAAETQKAPEQPAAAPESAPVQESAPQETEVTASDLEIDETDLELGDSPDLGIYAEIDVPTEE